MANFIWTAILYISTVGIVYISYRAFAMDRKADIESRVNDMINRSYAKGPGKAAIASRLPQPGRGRPAAPKRTAA